MNKLYYQHHIFFCTNQRADGIACCGDHDPQRMRDYMKQKVKKENLRGPGLVRVNTAGCMARCDKGPVAVVYPDAVWYTYQNEADLDEIVEEHFKHGRIVERLLIDKE